MKNLPVAFDDLSPAIDETAAPARPAATRTQRPSTLLDQSLPELESWMIAHGHQPFRARQVFDWVYGNFALGYAEMKNVPISARQELAVELPLSPMETVRTLTSSNGDTVKTLYRTFDGQFVETVLMLYRKRATVCVSCQIGCAVGCSFCATGLGGLGRNLSTGEMVFQVIDSARIARTLERKVTNIVMMGMGEPFHNYDATIGFVALINDQKAMGLGARRITISTAGVVPRIDQLATEPWQVNLAVSLHAPNDELRSQLVPLNRRYPVADLLAAVDRYTARTGRRVSFEYALMRGINDSEAIAAELAALLRGRLCHVNLIPLNPVDVLPYDRPDPASIERFAAILLESGIATTVRYSRGLDIAAACGQLRAQQERATAS